MRASRVGVVDLDALGQVGQVALEHGLDGGVLVLGVATSKVDDVARRGGQGGAADAGRRVEAGRPRSVTANSSARMPLWMSR